MLGQVGVKVGVKAKVKDYSWEIFNLGGLNASICVISFFNMPIILSGIISLH